MWLVFVCFGLLSHRQLSYCTTVHLQQVLEGHTDFINSLTFDPNTGSQLASAGDDHWCRIWGQDGNQVLSFPLGAPGMSVCWHKEEPMKVGSFP